MDRQALTEELIEPIRSTLIPYLQKTKTERQLLDLLEGDAEPMDWIRAPSYRAAMVAYLARKLGDERTKTRNALMPRALSIKSSIDTDRFSPDGYIDRILADADATFGGPR
jgi:hypothetical protein